MKHKVKTIFVAGLKALIPLGITIGLVYWILHMIEALFGFLLKLVIPAQYYYPGMGLALGLVVVFAFGIVINTWLTRKFYSWGEAILKRIPFVKTIYNGMIDLMSFFDKERMKEGTVVMVDINGMRLMGLLTRDNFDDLPEGVGRPGEVAVFLPLAYQIGGYTIWVPREKVQKVDMTVDWAMRFSITAGMINGK